MSAQSSMDTGSFKQGLQGADNLTDIVPSKLSLQDQHIQAAHAAFIVRHEHSQAPKESAGTDNVQGEAHTTAGLLVQHKSKSKNAPKPASVPAVELVNTSNVAQGDGLLEQLPAGVLHQLIKNLPRQSQLALFATSKRLTHRMLDAAAGVTLVLGPKMWGLPPGRTEVRRRVITKILSMRQEFAVQLYSAAWQPFPTDLADRVTSLTVTSMSHPSKHPVTTCSQWSAMTSLRTVALVRNRQDINDLFKAVKAGQLTKLENCSLTQCTLAKGMMQQLCKHPTLRHVTLQQCNFQGDHSQRRCRWETITLDSPAQSELARLPLAGVQQLRLIGGLSKISDNAEAVQHTISQYWHQIACLPYVCDKERPPMFHLHHPCEAMVPLRSRMQGVEMLIISGKVSSPDVLPLLWQASPRSVSRLAFWKPQGVGWPQLWQNMPQHVSRVDLLDCAMQRPELCTLVRSAPLHVCRIHVLCAQRRGALWQAADMRAAIPPHLEVSGSHHVEDVFKSTG